MFTTVVSSTTMKNPKQATATVTDGLPAIRRRIVAMSSAPFSARHGERRQRER
jgi:hypothetical protein